MAPYAGAKIYKYFAARPETGQERLVHIKTGLRMLAISPFGGVGLNNSNVFRDRFTIGGASTEDLGLPIHDHHLLQLVEAGLIGAGFGYLFVLGILRRAYRLLKSKEALAVTFAAGTIGAYSCLGVHLIVDFLNLDALQTIFWCYSGFVVLLWDSEQKGMPVAAA